jgi:hypothetical protein
MGTMKNALSTSPYTPMQRLALRKADALDLLADKTADLGARAEIIARADVLRVRVSAEITEAVR